MHAYARRCASPGAMLGCIDPVLTIAAASSLSRPPFLESLGEKREHFYEQRLFLGLPLLLELLIELLPSRC